MLKKTHLIFILYRAPPSELITLLCFRNFHHKSKTESDTSSDPEDHIYEEIDSDYFGENDEEDMETDNFLLGISLERQRNLKFYGSAGWDFGNVT